jgi:hypothetical protein
MARIRAVKPELFRHESLFEAEQECQLPLRLAFIGLFACCDREGRFRWRPRQLKLDVLPYDSIDFSRVLDALATRSFLVKYEVAGEVYGCIPSWKKHQVVNNKEMESELPSFEDSREVDAFEPQPEIEKVHKNNELGTRTSRVMHASSTRSQSSLESLRNFQGEYGIWKGNMEEERNMEQEGERECKGEGEGIALTRSVALTRLFDNGNLTTVFEYWKAVLQHPQAKLDNKRKKLIH